MNVKKWGTYFKMYNVLENGIQSEIRMHLISKIVLNANKSSDLIQIIKIVKAQSWILNLKNEDFDSLISYVVWTVAVLSKFYV